MYSKTVPAGLLFCLFLSAFTLTELLTSAENSEPAALNVTKNRWLVSEALVWGKIQIVKDRSGKNIIQWSTLKENNTKEFLIQHSENGHTFRAFKRIVAAGNTNMANQYEATDNKATGDLYYRIIGIDNEGQVFYSEIVNTIERSKVKS